MAIVRTYICGECSTKFDKLHFDRSEPPPECPGCKALEAKQVPAGFSINKNAAKAGDMAGEILMTDYGMSPREINDHQRTGDIAMKTPAHLSKQVDGFFKPNNIPVAPGTLVQAAKATAALNMAEGRNPISMLQRGRKAANVTGVPVKAVNNTR